MQKSGQDGNRIQNAFHRQIPPEFPRLRFFHILHGRPENYVKIGKICQQGFNYACVCRDYDPLATMFQIVTHSVTGA